MNFQARAKAIVDGRDGEPRSTMLHKSVALLTRTLESISPYRRVVAFEKQLNDLARRAAFPVRASGRNAIGSHAHHEAGRSPMWQRTTRCA